LPVIEISTNSNASHTEWRMQGGVSQIIFKGPIKDHFSSNFSEDFSVIFPPKALKYAYTV
jgi:alkyl hydroperoxide reductase subunit AhpC